MFFGSKARAVRRVERAGVGDPMASWHRLRRMRVFGDGEADWRVEASWQSVRARRKRLRAM